MSRPFRRLLIGAALASVVVALALPMAIRGLLWRWEQNPVLRGRLLAQEVGCHSCHLPYAGVEIPNPDSRWGSVPRFATGNAMMYAEDRREVEEYIRYGAPKVWLEDEAARARLERQRLRMPAYEDQLEERQIADLVAYASAIEGIELVGGEEAQAGRRLARQHGCLACHGVEGSGGHPNPGSLGGFVPGFVGGNFEDLVRDEAEFREWVRSGTSRRLESKPWIRYFWDRQTLTMPAYGDALSEEDLGWIWSWIQALRSDPGE